MMNQKGFTLIELVVVIVILGILAAFAVPRFVNLQQDARIATVKGLQGSLQSAAALARAQQLAQNLASNGTITVDGNVVQLAGGYPNNTTINLMLQSYEGFNFAGGVFSQAGAPTPANCGVTYNNAANGNFPAVTLASAGC